MEKEESRNHGIWLKCFIKAMKESLKTGLRFYPRDDDVVMLKEILTKLSDPILAKMLKQGRAFKITTKYEVEKSASK